MIVTLKDFESVLQRVIKSDSLTQALKTAQVSPIEFFKYLNDNPTLKTRFELARQISLEQTMDDNTRGIDECVTDLDIKKAQLKIRTNQWMLEKLVPQVYGARLDVNVHKTIDIRGVLEDARSRVYVSSDVIELKELEAKPEGESCPDILG